MTVLTFRAMDAHSRDLTLFGECFARNGSERAGAALQWQYLDNPTRELFVDLAVADAGARIAAIYATLPIFVRVGGQRRLALQSLDTLTDADFRGKGLFTKLAGATFARAEQRGAAFIYGFPNGASAPGFFKKLGWVKLDPVPFLIRPLRTRYVAERLHLAERLRVPPHALPDLPLHLGEPPVPPWLRLERIDRFDARFDALWEDFAAGVGVAVERGAEYLNWRLVDKPGESYENLALFDRQGRAVAFASFCVKDKHGGRVGYLMELLHRPGRRAAAWLLAQRALARMTRARADVALAWCLPHSLPYPALLASGFAPLPERFRPIELHMGVRPFDASLTGLLGARESWYVSYLDSDTV